MTSAQNEFSLAKCRWRFDPLLHLSVQPCPPTHVLTHPLSHFILSFLSGSPQVQDVTRDIISAVFRRSDTIHISFLTKGIIRAGLSRPICALRWIDMYKHPCPMLNVL